MSAPKPVKMATGGKPDRAKCVAFFQTGIAMMKSDETRQSLTDRAIEKPGQKLIEMQRAGWDTLDIDRDVGCNALDSLEQDFPDDQELIDMKFEFIHSASRSYIQSLNDRAPTKLETKKKLPRAVIIEFFEACNIQMGIPEFQDKLARHMQDKKSPPNSIIVEMQRDMLEVFGWEKEHGCRMLSNLSKDFPNDQELFQHFHRWSGVAQQTCMRIVQGHMRANGECPMAQHIENPDPKFLEMKEKAEAEIDAMTPEEQDKCAEDMQKKIQVFAQLPNEAKLRYMQKLGEEDKVELVKAQVLMTRKMKAAWEKQQGSTNKSSGYEDSSAPAPASAVPPAPPQQQMM
jgi:hypothetical protein